MHVGIPDFLNRVVTSFDRVGFSEADPYGHLNSTRLIEKAINHRSGALLDQIKFSTLGFTQTKKKGFFLVDLKTQFVSQAYIDQWLEVGSWLGSYNERNCEVKVLISQKESKKIVGAVRLGFVCFDYVTQKTCPWPNDFEIKDERNLLLERPLASEYLTQFTGIPSEFLK